MTLPYDRDQAMPPPDWGRVLVNTAQKKAPAGDPTLWGNTVTTLIDEVSFEAHPPMTTFYSEQIVMAKAADQYSRSWSVTGAVSLPPVVWGMTPANPPIGLTPPDGTTFSVYLSVLQGMEKVTIEHVILLACGGSFGLCNAQSTVNNGPYVPTTPDPNLETRAFAAIGALIGNSIAMRAVFVRSGDESFIPRATISLMVAPAAAGAGI